MDEKFLQALYGQLNSTHDLGSYGDFKQQMNDSKYQQAIYKAAGPSLDVGTFDDFTGLLKKKSQDSSEPSPGSPPVSDGKASSTIGTSLVPAPASREDPNQQLDLINNLGVPILKVPVEAAIDASNEQDQNTPDESTPGFRPVTPMATIHEAPQISAQQAMEESKPDATISAASINGSFNTGLAKITDAGAGLMKLYDALNDKITPGSAASHKAFNQYDTAALFDWASNWLRKTGSDNPLPDNFAGKATDAVTQTVPTLLAAAVTGGATAEGSAIDALGTEAGGYLSKLGIFQKALTQAASPLTKYLGTAGALQGFNEGYDQSGGQILPTLLKGAERGGEGLESGIGLEGQMAAGGKIGGTLFEGAVKAGVASEDGLITKQALKSFIGSPVAFATSSIVDDLAAGKPINWENAAVSGVTALPFEGEHLIDAYGEAKDLSEKKKILDDHINQITQIADNNAITNFMTAAPDDIFKAMSRPETADELQVMALSKGVQAQDAENYKDKNTLHLEQLELQQSADIKKIGDDIVKNGPELLQSAMVQTELPDGMKASFIGNAQLVNKGFNPTELEKTDLGKQINVYSGQIQQVQGLIDATQDPGDKQTHYLTMNDLVGKKVGAQNSLFTISADHMAEVQEKQRQINALEAERSNTHNLVNEIPSENHFENTFGVPGTEFNGKTADESHRNIDAHYDQRLNNIKDGTTPSDEVLSATAPIPEAPAAEAQATDQEAAPPAFTSTEENGEVNAIKPLAVTNDALGDAQITGAKEDGTVTLQMANGETENLAPEDIKSLGIEQEVNEFKKQNNIPNEEVSTHDRIVDLAGRIASGDPEYSDADQKLHSLYPDQVNQEIARIRAEKSGSSTVDALPSQSAETGGSENQLNPKQIEVVKNAMTKLFPEIRTHYYPSVEAFNEAASKTSLKKFIERGGHVHAFVDINKEIHFNPEFMEQDTQLHEQGHILTSWAYHYNRELYNKMISVGTSLGNIHAELRANGYDLKGVPLYEEAFVTALGRAGADRIGELSNRPDKVNMIRQFIHEAWTQFTRWVAGKTGFDIDRLKNIQDMKIPEFIDYVNDKYQLSDVKVSDISSEDLADKNNKLIDEASQSNPKPERKPGEPLREYIARLTEWKERSKADPAENVPDDLESKPALPVDEEHAPNWELDPETREEKFGRRWQDYLNRQKKAQETIDRSGGRINESTDYYNAADLQGAKIANAQRELYEKMVHSPEKDNPAFFERLSKDGVSKEDFDSYLRASHVEEYNNAVAERRREAYQNELDRMEGHLKDAKERKNAKSEDYYERAIKNLKDQKNSKYLLMNDGAAGMTNAEAKEILGRFKDEDKIDLLQKYGDEFIKEVSNQQLQVQLDSGVIDRDTYTMLKKKYQNYVPFHVEQHLEQKQGKNSATNMVRVDNLIRTAKGSTRTAAERVSPSTYGIVQLEKAHIEAEKNKTLNKLYNLVEQNPNPIWEIVHPKYSPINRKDGTVSGFKEITPADVVKNSMQLYRDGRKVYITIKDPGLLRAISRDGIARIPEFLAPLTGLNNYMRTVSTVLSPEFWVTNSIKHIGLGAFNLTSDGQKDIAWKLLKNSVPAMKGAFDFEHGKREGEWAPYVERYLAAGGKLTGIAPAGDTEKIKSIESLINDIGKKKNLAQNTRAFIHYASTFGDASGVGPRLAMFRAGTENGLTDQQAASLSREATINFNKKGEWSGLANTFYLMFNAGAQGKFYMIKKLINSPIARKMYGGMFVAGVMSAAMNAAFKKDDDDPVSEYEKQNNFILKNPYGTGDFKFPIPFGLNVPYYMGTKIFEVFHGDDTPGKASLDVLANTAASFSPVAHSDILQLITPTEPLRSVVQYAENKNNFGSPIKKDNEKFGVTTPASHTHFGNTDPAFVSIAQGLNHITGGTGVKSGLLDFSPDAMQWLYSTATGGLGATAQETGHTAYHEGEVAAQKLGFMPQSMQLTPLEVNKVPFLRKFYTEGSPVNYKSVIFGTLQKSGNSEISGPETTDFLNALMGATVKGQINGKQFKQYRDEFMQNQLRIQMGNVLPDMEKNELDMIDKKRRK